MINKIWKYEWRITEKFLKYDQPYFLFIFGLVWYSIFINKTSAAMI